MYTHTLINYSRTGKILTTIDFLVGSLVEGGVLHKRTILLSDPSWWGRIARGGGGGGFLGGFHD